MEAAASSTNIAPRTTSLSKRSASALMTRFSTDAATYPVLMIAPAARRDRRHLGDARHEVGDVNYRLPRPRRARAADSRRAKSLGNGEGRAGVGIGSATMGRPIEEPPRRRATPQTYPKTRSASRAAGERAAERSTDHRGHRRGRAEHAHRRPRSDSGDVSDRDQHAHEREPVAENHEAAASADSKLEARPSSTLPIATPTRPSASTRFSP